MDGDIKYSIVVPAYNEEEVIEESYKRLKDVMEQIGEKYEIIFVNDGCRDKTPEIAAKMADAGIQRISVSLDGATAQNHDAFRGVQGAFQGALDGIENALREIANHLKLLSAK